MKRCLGALLAAMTIAITLAEDDLPQPDENEPLAVEPLEIDPPMLIQSRGPDGLPVVPAPPEKIELAKLESDLTKARKSAASGDRMYKAGIIAKVEAEERVLKVVRLEAKLAEARRDEAKSQMENETPEPAAAEALAQATAAAEQAIAERRRAELEAAVRNLQRQQKLLALGSGRKADVNRAEKKLADLQSGQN
jgi:hypothetical protein